MKRMIEDEWGMSVRRPIKACQIATVTRLFMKLFRTTSPAVVKLGTVS